MTDKLSMLVEKLRAASSYDLRREIALQLTAIKEDEAHDELYRMANGEIRAYSSRTWKTLWTKKAIMYDLEVAQFEADQRAAPPKKPIMYDLEDQLIAIEVLAETGTEKALNFLKNIKKSKSDLPGPEKVWGPYYEMMGYGSGSIYYNAKGELRVALDNGDSEVHHRVDNAIKKIEEMHEKSLDMHENKSSKLNLSMGLRQG